MAFKKRGLNWEQQRQKALERDNHTCSRCGKVSRKLTNPKLHDLDVHHKKPYWQFYGDYIKANDLSNLVSLCSACHVIVEAEIKNPLNLPKVGTGKSKYNPFSKP